MGAIGEFLLYLWRLSRPETWMVSVFPVYAGYVLGSHELLPGLALWTGFWSHALSSGATFSEFASTFSAWVREAQALLLGALALGPLAWTATLLINDVHDLPGDRLNPRKARSPLVQGLVDVGLAHGLAYVAAALALCVAALAGRAFFGLTLACLVLAWLYSVPPVRLKTRPGADVLVNAVGIGAFAGLAGWSLVAPLASAPYRFFPQAMLLAVAIYVPTTLVDHDADRAAGYLTIATHLGPRRAYRVGWLAWLLANAGALVLSWNGWILPRRFFPILAIFVPLLVYEYHVFIGRARTPPDMVRGVILCGLTFMAVNLVFALMYTGLWVG